MRPTPFTTLFAILLLVLLLSTVGLHAQESIGGGLYGPSSRVQRVSFANLGTPIAGNVRYCLDCLATSPCTGGGTGAFAYRVGAAWNCNVGSAGSGDVAGPASSTDNAIARFDSTTGKLLKNSSVTIDASGSINLPAGQVISFGGVANTMLYTNAVGPRWEDATTGNFLRFDVQTMTNDRTFIWPDATGTVALTSSNVATATALAANPTDCAANNFATAIAASGNLTCTTVGSVTNLAVSTGVTNANGMQHARVASCETAASANATCDTTVTWPVAFADTSYTATATLDSTSGGLVMILSTKNKTTTSIDVTIVTLTAAASSGTINLVGMHD